MKRRCNGLCVKVIDIFDGPGYNGSYNDVVYSHDECWVHGLNFDPEPKSQLLKAQEFDRLNLQEAYENGWTW